MPNRNDRNSLMDCLMNRRVVVSGLVAIFVIVSLVSPAIAQASTDAVLIMHFDEGSGTIAKDESGHGNDGTIHGATWTTGISGKALSFDGSNDYVEVPDDNSLETNGEKTIELWAKPADDTTGNVPISKYKSDTPTEDGWIIAFDAHKKIRAWIKNAEGGGFEAANVTYEANQWYHVGMTWNTRGGNVKLYINGEYIGESDTISGVFPGNPVKVIIGNSYDWTGALSSYNWFHGTIDEVAIYSRALTAEEIKAHYLAKRAGGSTKESTSDLISSVSTRIDVLKRSNVDTSLIEDAFKNAQNAYDLGKYEESYELAQSALKMADDAYVTQQHIESAQSEIDEAKSIGAEVKEAEDKLKDAKDALNKGNYQYAQDWAVNASELAKHASIGSVQIKDLKALATKYDERTVVISGTIRDIETVYGKGYAFALDDGSGMISVAYQGSLGDIKDGDKVTASGIFQASTGTVVAENVQKSGVSGVPGFEVIFAIAGLLAVAYLLRRK